MKRLELKNVSFGRLTADTPEKINGKLGWHCKCHCGNTVWIPTFQLTSGNNTSCGCGRGDITGKRFGNLIAIRRSHRDEKNRRQAWVCRCDCGKERIAWSRNLQRGATTSCGCIKKTRKKRLDIERLIHSKYSEYKSNSKRRKRKFDIEIEYASRLFLTNCYYCSHPPDPLNGIDRKDNNYGYTVDNSVPCCSRCNYLKNDMNHDDFINIVNKISLIHNRMASRAEQNT